MDGTGLVHGWVGFEFGELEVCMREIKTNSGWIGFRHSSAYGVQGQSIAIFFRLEI